jgi:hypothetical protein
MRLFQLRVSIVGVPKVYRIIDASENCTFEDLHETIFGAFNRYDPHLYSFLITKSDTKNFRTIWSAPEITHPENTEDFMGFGEKKMSVATIKIGDVGLKEKDVFHYLFDFGDDWWHRIRVQSIRKGAFRREHKHIMVVKSVGSSPPQYPDYDEYEDDEY